MKKTFFTSIALFLLISVCFSQEKEPLIRNWVFPEREKSADSKLVDLTEYYTAALDDDWLVSAGANLKKLPKGIQSFDTVTFDVRGVVQLGGLALYKESDYTIEEQKIKYPDKVTGIKINQKAPIIYFLHASAWGEETGKEIGQYIIRYADGTSVTISIKYMDSLRDWWFLPEDEMPSNATQAWTGLNDLTEKKGYQISLFTFKWENPNTNKKVESIDFISTMTEASPFLIAITLGE